MGAMKSMKVMKVVKAKKARTPMKPKKARFQPLPKIVRALEIKLFNKGGPDAIEMMWWNAKHGVFNCLTKKERVAARRYMTR